MISSEVFALLETKQVFILGNQKKTTPYKRLMQGLIAREPKNLLRHVQYIYGLLPHSRQERDALSSALVDLFIVLGSSGLALRRRLLASSKYYLDEEIYIFLDNNLDSGINEKTIFPEDCYSIFSTYINGEIAFIEKKPVQEFTYISAYDEAVSLLEYGDLESAQGLLEKSLREQPENTTIASELLAVYKHNDDQKALNEMTEWFNANNLKLPDRWPLL